ncbi:MAG: PAS domain S-box protein [Candidatus Abyssobacteria bacterium SURF_17]|uniref:PAS domain S-box protein n=1 Tax=Candidatus Abyssobacteria bacterium SURF_17 TaxID=2093361 RepID=A0A419F3B0_9BACT|nr:MAG: PAS domain S-box protein [Candidatus Abyssubacteria bacterium SURF_17]
MLESYCCNVVATYHCRRVIMNDFMKKDDADNWNERYRKLLDSLNIGYTLQDMEENILDVNETLLRMTGTRREQVVGHNNREFYTKKEFERMQEIALPLQQKGAYQFEFILPTVSGERIPVLYNSFINKDSEDRPNSINVMVTDIREQKKIQAELESANRALVSSREVLEKEKRKLEAILFGIGDSVTIFDLDGNLLLSNPRGMQIRGGRRTPLLPLRSGAQSELTLTADGEQHKFLGQVEVVRDDEGTPFAFVELLRDITDRVKLREREQELIRIKRELRRDGLRTEMVGVSGAMQKVFDLILRCAEVDSTVLIQGETGVGKELAALAIHSQSSRKDKPFVAVNCGALPETLLESELFGHVKGAFTGAISERAGLFREAHGGALFLDEVGDISQALQVKLLRALQEREIRPVGGDRSHPVDVRVIAATNKDLRELVESGRFRHDLYYRIAVIPLRIPPLRERTEDILPLAEHFIKKHGRKLKRPAGGLDHAAQQVLLEYSWPGNIRELENAIEHALAMARGPLITPENLPVQVVMGEPARKQEGTSQTLTSQAAEVEKAAILAVLRKYHGNRTRAAAELGISRTTLWRKITMYHLQ